MIALFEAAKGTIVLIAGLGLLTLIHADFQDFADNLIDALHLNPTGNLARRIIEVIGQITPANVRIIVVVSLLYAVVRFIEAYGLWRLRAWAKWFAIISGAVYIPIELYEFIRHPTFLSAAVLLLNIAIVAYLFYFRKGREGGEKIRESQTDPAY